MTEWKWASIFMFMNVLYEIETRSLKKYEEKSC